MAHYLIQVSYEPGAWAAFMANPQDRSTALRPVLEKLGGRMDQIFFTFGEYDVVAIVEMPGNVGAAAFAMAALGGGAVKSLKTTPLLSVSEGIDALRQAAASGYQPPSTGPKS